MGPTLFDLRMTLDSDSECGYIKLTDITDYSPDEREDYALILFVFHGDIGSGLVIDEDLSDLSNPGNNNYPGEWFIDVLNRQDYQVILYGVLVWVAGSYSDGVIVFHEGYFYVNDSGGATTDEPGTTADWLVLDGTETGGYDYFEAALALYPATIAKDSDYQQMLCSRFQILKTACHTYSITDTWVTGTAEDIVVKNYNGVTIETITGPDPGGSVEWTVEEDGVYIIEVADESHIVFEMCDLDDCIVSMIDYVLCTADDPCAEKCTPTVRNVLRRYRTELNMIIALYFPMMAYIYTDKMAYIGLFSTIEGDRLACVSKVGDMMDKLKVITARCAVCDDSFDSSECDC